MKTESHTCMADYYVLKIIVTNKCYSFFFTFNLSPIEREATAISGKITRNSM